MSALHHNAAPNEAIIMSTTFSGCVLTATLTEGTTHRVSLMPSCAPPPPHSSSQRCLALPAEPCCASPHLPYSVKYRRCDSPAAAAACCSLQAQRSVPAVNRAVNPLKMRRCQQAVHAELTTSVGRDFFLPAHFHRRPPVHGAVGGTGRRWFFAGREPSTGPAAKPL